MMSFCLLLCLILTLQLVGVTTKTMVISTGIPPEKDPQDPQGQCAWWCNEMYGIIAIAAAGTVLFISIILCFVSCCLWKRIKASKQADMKTTELDLLVPPAALNSNSIFPVQDEPPATKDVGISDIENCTLNSEPPQTETPEDQTADEPAANYPPPENVPMLP